MEQALQWLMHWLIIGRSISLTGIDELQIVRIVLSNVLSLVIVIGISPRKRKATGRLTTGKKQRIG